MGWLSQHAERLAEEERKQAEALKKQKDLEASHADWAQRKATDLFIKAVEAHGKETPLGKISVMQDGPCVTVNVGTIEAAKVWFSVYEEMEGEHDGQGHGTGRFNIQTSVDYCGKRAYYFYESVFAEVVLDLLKGKLPTERK